MLRMKRNLSAASDLVPSMIYYHLARDIEKTGKYFGNDIEETPIHIVQQIEPNKLILTTEEDMNEETEPIETACPSNVLNPGKGSSESIHDVQQEWQKGWMYYEAIRELVTESNTRFGPMMLLNHGAMFFVASSNIFSILRWYFIDISYSYLIDDAQITLSNEIESLGIFKKSNIVIQSYRFHIVASS
jgi:hypothetical protein